MPYRDPNNLRKSEIDRELKRAQAMIVQARWIEAKGDYERADSMTYQALAIRARALAAKERWNRIAEGN